MNEITNEMVVEVPVEVKLPEGFKPEDVTVKTSVEVVQDEEFSDDTRGN